MPVASGTDPRTSRPGSEHQPGQKGVVATLQEFVQCSRHFVAQQHRPILQWAYGQRMANGTSLEFKGTAAFVLDGVPHHVAGGWQPSKKAAQRDVAQRALGFFIGRWGEQLLLEESGGGRVPKAPEGTSDIQVLEDFCRSYSACGGSRPKLSHNFDGSGMYTGLLEVLLLDVPHKFAGAPKRTRAAASADVARRVLWYLQCPGYERGFVPDPESPAVAGKDIPAPPENWACSKEEAEESRQAERKTILMRVQNRLQQEFAKRLRPGEGVWEWSYEMNDRDNVWPPLYRARVVIAPLHKVFVGEWARGQREAQVEACALVSDYLDRGAGTPSGSSLTN